MLNNEANLITNSAGAIYHLHLTPEDICPIIITVGDPGRVDLIAQHLDYLDKDISHREFHAVIGTLGDLRIMILSTGIGPDNIDIVMTELHALFLQAKSKGLLNVPMLKFIRLGTSASINKDHPLDSILISSRAIGLDNIPSFYQSIHTHLQNHQTDLPFYKVNASEDLLKTFQHIKNAKTGTTLTCPGFYGPQFRSVHLKPAWDLDKIKYQFIQKNIDLSNIEMESAAIYFFARELGHQAISINALIADRLTNRFSQKPEQMVQDMITLAMEALHS